MTDTTEIVDGVVALLQEISELVDEMNDDEDRIFAYHDLWPKKSSIMAAIHEMPAPSIMVAWIGSGPSSFGGVEVWQHQIRCYLRVREPDGDSPTYFTLFRLMTKGVPTSTGVAMQYSEVHSSCHPMDTPTISRQTDAEGVDYFEVAMNFTEMGDA